MKVGLQLPYFTYPGAEGSLAQTFGRIARDADEAGFYSLWVMDHFFQIGGLGPKELEMLECYSALSYAAAITSRIKLGPLVVGVTYRHPGILVKTATALDVLSDGRSYFGVGAAWNDDEHAGLGVPFPARRERFEKLEETLQIALKMWADEPSTFEGKHFKLEETLNMPNSVQRPHPPIMIGGGGEQKTLRLVARYADACNIFAGRGMEFVQHKYSVLREWCDVEGRPYEAIEKTTLGQVIVTADGQRPADAFNRPERERVMSTSEALEYFHQLAELGTDHAIVNSGASHIPGALDIWATEIIPAVEKIVPAGRNA